MELVNIRLNQTDRNPANPRSKYDVGLLAQLTLSMYAKGWDTDNPMLVGPPNDEGIHPILRGHRRRKCWLMSLMLQDTYPPSDSGGVNTDVTIEIVTDQWNEMIAEIGDVDAVEDELLFMYGGVKINAVLSPLTGKDAYLKMVGDGTGSEDYDTLGIVRSLKFGVKQYALTDKDVAAIYGRSRDWARNMILLAKYDEEVVQRVANGELTVKFGALLERLPAERRQGMRDVVMSVAPADFRVKILEAAVKAVEGWSMAYPLTFRNQLQRNMARAFMGAWSSALQNNPDAAWKAVCAIAWLRGSIPEPWEKRETAELWLNTMGIGSPTSGWKIRLWSFLTDVSCSTCPINNMPSEKLQADVKTPCRRPDFDGGTQDRCFNGLAPSDGFMVVVPADWAEHVKTPTFVNGKVVMNSYEDMMAAWNKQRDSEAAEAMAEAMIEDDPDLAATDAPTDSNSVPPTEPTSAPTATSAPSPTTTSTPAPPPPAAKTAATKTAEPRPIDLQRKKIAAYIKLADIMPLQSHVLAGNCATCAHKTDEPPAKGKNIPNCAWAARSNDVEFGALQAIGTLDTVIPMCAQYQPEGDWKSIIPETAPAAFMTRDWMIDAIENAMISAPAYTSGQFEMMHFLCGRPINRKLPSSQFDFMTLFKERRGDLSNGQLATLLMWVVGEQRRFSTSIRSQSGKPHFLVQINGVLTECDYISFNKINKKAVKAAAK